MNLGLTFSSQLLGVPDSLFLFLKIKMPVTGFVINYVLILKSKITKLLDILY